jgi:hypothetical protein
MSPWVRRRVISQSKRRWRFDLALVAVGFILVVTVIRMCSQ